MPTAGSMPELAALAPAGERRMGANPHANGGVLLRDLRLPDFRDYAVAVPTPGGTLAESTRAMGTFLRDVMQKNPDNFRVFGPDETASNRLGALFEVTNRTWMAERFDYDDHLAADGRVMEFLSEHACQGWLEGYLLTGRHGLFSCYEAFIHIVDSMFNQHAKWLKVCREIPWRRPIASLNILLTSHVWRQDNNGFSHQDPGFIDHVVNKKADIIRVYLPPDANTLLYVTDQCLKSRNLINVIVAGKQPELQWLDMDAAINHASAGIGMWEWACNDQSGEPDVVLAAAGDVPTLEMLAAIDILRELTPELKIRFINVVDLMTLQPQEEHPHGLSQQGIRLAVHHRQADHLRLPRLPVADPSPHLPPHQSRQSARARLQGGRHHHHAVRHGGAQHPRPLPSGDGCGEPGAEAAGTGGAHQAAHARQAQPAHAIHPRARRRHAGDTQLDLAVSGRKQVKDNPLLALKALGQHLWLDNLSRALLREGTLQRLIDDDGIDGVTSNPAIFRKAIADSPYYREDLARLRGATLGADECYEALVIPDIQAACDILLPAHVSSRGETGYVSLEVAPALAHDTAGTLAAARRLRQAVGRDNLLVKIPGNARGGARFRAG